MASTQFYSDVLTKIDDLTKHTEKYLSVQNEKAKGIKDLTKLIYDFVKHDEGKTTKSNALPELIVQDFDEEQIWQELELQNESIWTHFVKDVSKCVSLKDNLKFPIVGKVHHSADEEEMESLEYHDDDEDEVVKSEEVIEEEKRKKNPNMTEHKGDQNCSEPAISYCPEVQGLRCQQRWHSSWTEVQNICLYTARICEQYFEHKARADLQIKFYNIEFSNIFIEGFSLFNLKCHDISQKKYIRKSIVDDDFFKLQELENFLNIEDKKEAHSHTKGKRNRDTESESDNEIDLFEDAESDESDAEGADNDMKYEHFFDRPDERNYYRDNKRKGIRNYGADDVDDFEENPSGGESEIDLGDLEDTDVKAEKKKSVKFNLEDSSDDDDSDPAEVENSTATTGKLSEYELRQQRLLRKIDHLENKNLSEKPWQMKGEVDATTRPQNSLLEEVVDFDMTTRPAPIITEETTFKLEDIIRQRIKDKVWDDVERKAKPTDEPQEFKKKLILDQEKSKSSLAQVYEQEYIKQREALNPNAEKIEDEPKEHKEIKKAMKTLFSKLDALSNYHYTPKVAVPEVKIISNIPAISMEEVAPVATSDAALLAPEEVKGKLKGELMAKSERTDTDKKRERRKKKVYQREREKEKEKREKLLEKLRPGIGNKYSKEKATKLLEKVSKERNVDKMIEINDNRALKSSKSFFTQLQDDMSSSIKGRVKVSRKKKDTLPAKKYKL